jgi:hypothetical protein
MQRRISVLLGYLEWHGYSDLAPILPSCSYCDPKAGTCVSARESINVKRLGPVQLDGPSWDTRVGSRVDKRKTVRSSIAGWLKLGHACRLESR